MDKNIDELVLLLLYVTSWEEKGFPGPVHRSWKGYPWETLDALEEQGFIRQGRRAKSVYLTEQGVKQAEVVRKKFKT